MYWESRSSNITVGGLGWDMQYAFRGHLVVLINEHTSSDGEAFARGVSELGLGKLVGKRTWGGGIWLSSDNKLVDGGIASAPEVGTYNDKVSEIFSHCFIDFIKGLSHLSPMLSDFFPAVPHHLTPSPS